MKRERDRRVKEKNIKERMRIQPHKYMELNQTLIYQDHHCECFYISFENGE
jgi:hypothetical protein